MNEVINIALAADGGYFDQLFVTATSMAKYARQDVELSFNILDGGISKSKWNYLVERVKLCHSASIFNRIPVNEELFAAYPKWNGNRMAYARLLLPNVLKDVEWILYSDCDFLWLRDVAELWQERDNKFSVVAVRDVGSWEKKERAWFEKNGYSIDGAYYFCSGMCLFNLKKFRDEHLIQKVWDVLSAHSDFNYPDQAALNVVCAGSIKLVPRKWMCFTLDLTQELLDNAVVLHMACEVPWRFRNKMQMLSDPMLIWHKFFAFMCGGTCWQSLRRRFSPSQIVFHRLLVYMFRCPLIRFQIYLIALLSNHIGVYSHWKICSRRFIWRKHDLMGS